jgi:tetratricopeptide (TPR) repeat protein
MSFTGTMTVADQPKASQTWLREHRGVQFAIAVAGSLISWRLSSPRFIHLPSPPPASFADRLLLAGPPLLGLGLCVAFICWGSFLFNRYADSSEPRLAGAAQAAARKRTPLWFKLTFAIAFAAPVALEWGMLYVRYLWPSHAKAISQQAHVAMLLVSLVGLFAGAVIKRKQTSPSAPGSAVEEKSWLDSRQVRFVIATVVGVAVLIVIGRLGKIYFPEHLHLVLRIGALALSALTVGFLVIEPRKSEPAAGTPLLDAERLNTAARTPRSRPRVSASTVVGVVLGTSIVGVLLLPVDPHLKRLLSVVPVLLLALIGSAFSSVKRRVLRLAKQGDYDEALRVDKQFSWIPGYGTSLEGTILFQAGRYSEAQALLKPLAYESDGQPKRTGTALYVYTLALENGGREAEAQALLEGAVQVPQMSGGFHITLATCLLSQDKDPQRALELIEQAMSNWPISLDRYEARSDQMMRLARYAWALAACGRREDAQAQLQQAFAGTAGFRPADLAGLQYFAGETWRVLGDTAKARAAFNEALRLAVPGSAPATSAQKAMAKLVNR